MYRLLIVDDDAEQLAAYRRYLSRTGHPWLIDGAGSAAEARRLVAAGRYHLAIVDRSLHSQGDRLDRSGEDLACELAHQCPVFVMTQHDWSFEDYDDFYRRSSPVNGGYPVRSFSKKRTMAEIAGLAAAALREDVPVNWTLDWIGDQPGGIAEAMVSRKQRAVAGELALDLDELLRQLFGEYGEITVERIAAGGDACLLHVAARVPPSQRSHWVVHCQRRLPAAPPPEPLHGAQHVKRFARRTYRSLVGTVYDLDGDDGSAQQLGDFYRHCDDAGERAADGAGTLCVEVARLFGPAAEADAENLFDLGLRWFGLDRATVRPDSLTTIAASVCMLSGVPVTLRYLREQQQLMIGVPGSPPRYYPYPADLGDRGAHFADLRAAVVAMPPPLELQTMLMEPEGRRAWLLNLQPGPLAAPPLFQWAWLETQLRLTLLHHDRRTLGLDQRNLLDERLLAAERLDAPIAHEGLAPAALKCARAIARVRAWAASHCAGPADMAIYKVGLLLARLRLLVEIGSDPADHDWLPRADRLLSLAVCFSKLPSRHVRAGWLELDLKEHQAWVDGKPCKLTPGQFTLLQLLAEHPDELVTYEAIDRHMGYSAHDDPRTAREPRISRLRSALGPRGRTGIKAEHNKGLRLVTRP